MTTTSPLFPLLLTRCNKVKASRKLMVAERGKDWIVADWSREVELMKGIRMNLEELLREEGVL